MTIALIKADICINTIEADEAFAAQCVADGMCDSYVDCSGGLESYGIGMKWDGTRFYSFEDAVSAGKI
jgi:hypothetical protein